MSLPKQNVSFTYKVKMQNVMLRFDRKQLKRNWKLAKIACCQIFHMSTM